MPLQIELFGQMTLILDTLVENAKKMKEGLRLKCSQEELEALQNRQHEILAELGKLNTLLDASPPGGTEAEIEACKSHIRDRLAQFQSVNKEFFDQINSSSRVIDKRDTKIPRSRSHRYRPGHS